MLLNICPLFSCNSTSDKIYLGNSTVLGVYDYTGLFTASDGRFKTNVLENVKGLEYINKLRPVTYKLNTEAFDDFLIQSMPDSLKQLHKAGLNFTASGEIIHSGFIAQEVEQVNQETGFTNSIVSTPSNDHDHYALSYAEFVVPLVKAVQELSKGADSLQKEITNQDSINVYLTNEIRELKDIINACCTANKQSTIGANLNTSNVGTNEKDITLSNSQLIVLNQNSPNPFAEQTSINYSLPEDCKTAQIVFYNIEGSLIKTVELLQKGHGQLNVFANDLSNGVYTYSLIVDGKIFATKKMEKQQ